MLGGPDFRVQAPALEAVAGTKVFLAGEGGLIVEPTSSFTLNLTGVDSDPLEQTEGCSGNEGMQALDRHAGTRGLPLPSSAGPLPLWMLAVPTGGTCALRAQGHVLLSQR